MVATLALSSSLLSNPIKGEFHHRTLVGLSSQWRTNQIANAFSNWKRSHKRLPYGNFNRYSTFVNWELWWPQFPILVYFKETQTKPEGQIHFFPVIFNGRQLYDVMVERAGPSKTSSPK
ncbi:hypothetical protein FCM35_KLT00829 [Carex littledalei]|uniref:Uncharacterized protein n=1 Tax=Carex littledalei TaxID=544730 RepID=A0A833R4D2_9POAL|nr:hypothetical protein FCM35_KLT00829 [Carex littledalei]